MLVEVCSNAGSRDRLEHRPERRPDQRPRMEPSRATLSFHMLPEDRRCL